MTSTQQEFLQSAADKMVKYKAPLYHQLLRFRIFMRGIGLISERRRENKEPTLFSRIQSWIKKFAANTSEWKDEPKELAEFFWDTLEQYWSNENADNRMISRRVIAPLEKWPHANGIDNVLVLIDTSNYIDSDSDFKFSQVLMSIFRAAKFEKHAFFVMQSLLALILQRRETEELRRLEEEYALYVPYIELEEALASEDEQELDIAKAVNKTDEASEDEAKKIVDMRNPAELRLSEIDDAICECMQALFVILHPYEPFSCNVREIVNAADADAKKKRAAAKESGSVKNSASNSPSGTPQATPTKRKRDDIDVDKPKSPPTATAPEAVEKTQETVNL